MKKSFLILMVIALMSLSAKAQINFSASALANGTTSVTMSSTHIYAFVPGQLYFAPISKILEWQGLEVLPSVSPAVNSGFLEDKLFVLLENGELYSFIEGAFKLEKEGIIGMSVNDHGLFAWNTEKIFQYNYEWFAELSYPGVRYATASGRDIIIVDDNNEIFHGPVLQNLELFGNTEINVIKYLLTPNYYAYVGTHFMSGEAAYHISPGDICVPVDHVLTTGMLSSVVAFNDKVYIGGRLGSKGIVFDAYDMSTMNLFDAEIKGMCANDYAIAAWSGETLYLSINQTASIQKQGSSLSEFMIIENPVNDVLYITSAKQLELKIISLDGKIMAYHFLRPGINNINVASFSPGTYIASSQRGSKKFIVR